MQDEGQTQVKQANFGSSELPIDIPTTHIGEIYRGFVALE